MCAIKITLPQKSILVFSVYMPTDKNVNLVEFTDCLSLVSATISNEDIWTAYILGGLNAHPNELFFNEMMSFCREQMWTCPDIEILGLESDTFSFISEANGAKRWLDHVLTTESEARSVVNVHVKYDVTWSDHFPLCVVCNLGVISSGLLCSNKRKTNKVVWGERKSEQITLYTKICHGELSKIDFPDDLRACCDGCCYEQGHKQIIDNLYNAIISVLSVAATTCFYVKRSTKKKPVAGWNKHISAAHREARDKFNTWVLYGKPRCGRFYDEMQRSRTIFKSRLKWCQNHSEQIRMDILASLHENHDFRSFWKSTKKLNDKPYQPESVDGVSDHKDIATIFRKQFTVESPLGPSRKMVDEVPSSQEFVARFTAKYVDKVVKSMSRGKSPGYDGLSVNLKHAGPHLPRVLALLYNVCLSHSYLPDALMRTVVVPVIKNKSGDVSDKNNYRPISLATVVAKVLDSMLSTHLDKHLNIHQNQFGFRSGLSTETAILCLKQTVKYYTNRKTYKYMPVFSTCLKRST